jgi:hypothetical protein
MINTNRLLTTHRLFLPCSRTDPICARKNGLYLLNLLNLLFTEEGTVEDVD